MKIRQFQLSHILVLALLLFVFSCARAPLKDRSDAMRKASKGPQLSDDLDFESLKQGIAANIDFIQSSARAGNEFVFGKVKIPKKNYVAALKHLLENSSNIASFQNIVSQKFDFYEVYGSDDWAKIKVTSYYTPLLKGSIKKTKTFSQPLYLTPNDMVFIDVDSFVEAFPRWKIFKEQVLEQKSSSALVRGRLLTDKNNKARIIPYYKRDEIDTDKSVFEQDLVIAYVDPIESFFLQIQGSGLIELSDGSQFTVGYANQNGHPYVAIGSLLLDKIPKEKMSMQSIVSYLRSLPKKEAQKIMNQNPSYVFFQKTESRPLSYLGTEVVDGRTVATDAGLFPKGTLAFLEFEKPVFENSNSDEPKEWVKSARFVLDQDTGGAIRGPGRLDLYAGNGRDAEQFAGVMKNPAKLFYLVPKAEFLNSLRE